MRWMLWKRSPRPPPSFADSLSSLLHTNNALKSRESTLALLGLACAPQVAFPDPYELANAAKNLATALDMLGKSEEAEQLVCMECGPALVAPPSFPDPLRELTACVVGTAVLEVLGKPRVSAGPRRCWQRRREHGEPCLPPEGCKGQAVLGTIGPRQDGNTRGLERQQVHGLANGCGKPALVSCHPHSHSRNPRLHLFWDVSAGPRMDSGATADLLISIGAVLERNRLQPQAEALYVLALDIQKAMGKGESAEAATAHAALGALTGGSGMARAWVHCRSQAALTGSVLSRRLPAGTGEAPSGRHSAAQCREVAGKGLRQKPLAGCNISEQPWHAAPAP